MRGNRKIPKSVLKNIDNKLAKLKITKQDRVLKEVGIYYIECTQTNWSDGSVNCDIWVIKKSDYSDDVIENTLKAVDGSTLINNVNKANREYLRLRNKYMN